MSDVFFCEITENKVLTDAVYSMSITCSQIAAKALPGQFLHIKCGHSRILRRPISICNVHNDIITFVFEVKGDGTKWLSQKKPGQSLDILGPLGNGFTIPGGKIIVVGGGVGTPPMLFTAAKATQKPAAVLGFRSADRVILTEEFKAICEKIYITTDDGSYGIHGAVTKPLEELLKTGGYKVVMSCGQLLMQKAVADICAKYNVPSQVSLEERMGCGVGACLVCACATKSNAIESDALDPNAEDNKITMSRVCADGPVFKSNEVVWQESIK
ncbi:MAG: dihydroorotate dehydrogenase electron transfer subunit [Oscillospiraceae bacterium]|nr:dihydroorotate dehydrogenase electron transfer subunit [Oscillospiraceae bacterium]